MSFSPDPIQKQALEVPNDRSLLVTGEDGFGKTTVVLRRLAGIAEDARRGGRAFRALVLVPTPGLLRKCRELCPWVTPMVTESWIWSVVLAASSSVRR